MPHIHIEPDEYTEYFILTGLPWVTGNIIPAADGSADVDLSPAIPGTAYEIEITAANSSGVSPALPLPWTCPVPVPVPGTPVAEIVA